MLFFSSSLCEPTAPAGNYHRVPPTFSRGVFFVFVFRRSGLVALCSVIHHGSSCPINIYTQPRHAKSLLPPSLSRRNWEREWSGRDRNRARRARKEGERGKRVVAHTKQSSGLIFIRWKAVSHFKSHQFKRLCIRLPPPSLIDWDEFNESPLASPSWVVV